MKKGIVFRVFSGYMIAPGIHADQGGQQIDPAVVVGPVGGGQGRFVAAPVQSVDVGEKIAIFLGIYGKGQAPLTQLALTDYLPGQFPGLAQSRQDDA